VNIIPLKISSNNFKGMVATSIKNIILLRTKLKKAKEKPAKAELAFLWFCLSFIPSFKILKNLLNIKKAVYF